MAAVCGPLMLSLSTRRVPGDDSEDSEEVWYRFEIVELAKGIIPTGQIKGPFFRPLPDIGLDLSNEEEFFGIKA